VLFETGDHAEEEAFSGTGFAEDGDHFAIADPHAQGSKEQVGAGTLGKPAELCVCHLWSAGSYRSAKLRASRPGRCFVTPPGDWGNAGLQDLDESSSHALRHPRLRQNQFSPSKKAVMQRCSPPARRMIG
jgi:hypothetical protein